MAAWSVPNQPFKNEEIDGDVEKQSEQSGAEEDIESERIKA